MNILRRNFLQPLMSIVMRPIRGGFESAEEPDACCDMRETSVIKNHSADNDEDGIADLTTNVNVHQVNGEICKGYSGTENVDDLVIRNYNYENDDIFNKEIDTLYKSRARPNPEYNATGHKKYHTITKLYRSADRQRRFEEKIRLKRLQYEMERCRENEVIHNKLLDTWYRNQFKNKEAFNDLFVSWYDLDFDLEIQSIDDQASVKSSSNLGYNQQRSDDDSGVCGGEDCSKANNYNNMFMSCSKALEESSDIDLSDSMNIDIQNSFSFDLNGAKINNNLLPVMEKVKTLKDLSLYKSRFSLLSSLPDDPSEVVVCLSYYSRSTNHQISEDISFFTFDQLESIGNLSDINSVTVPISMSLIIMTAYIMFGAMVFSIWDDPDIMKWAYFSFVTLSTIGFGDIVPGTKIDSKNTKEKLILSSLYVAIGLSVFAMCIKLMQEEVVAKVKWLAQRIQEIKKNFQDEEDTD